MSEKLYLDWEEALTAVKLSSEWRFFADREVMFILDYSAYDDEYAPLPGGFRYGTLIVDKHNASAWMNTLAREFNVEQLPYLYWEDTEKRVQVTFVVDFDERRWVGNGWKMDQSPLTDYQPEGWTAVEDDVYQHLPLDLKSIWK
jgi:hypothetical protein